MTSWYPDCPRLYRGCRGGGSGENLQLGQGAKANSEDSSQGNETARRLHDRRCAAGLGAEGAHSQEGDSILVSGVLEEEEEGSEGIPDHSPVLAQSAECNCLADGQPLSCHGFSSP